MIQIIKHIENLDRTIPVLEKNENKVFHCQNFIVSIDSTILTCQRLSSDDNVHHWKNLDINGYFRSKVIEKLELA